MKERIAYICDLYGNYYPIPDLRVTISQLETLLNLDNRIRGLTVLERHYWEDMLGKMKTVSRSNHY